MFGHIYKTTNLINNKIYIGKKQGKPERWYLGSGLILNKAIKKYGKNKFKYEILSYAEDKIVLNKLEKEFITYYKNILPAKTLYNIAPGGTGGRVKDVYTFSIQHRKRIRQALKGRIITQEARDKITKTLIAKGGHIKTCKCPWCKARRGEMVYTKERNEKISKAMTGKAHPCKAHKMGCICISCKTKRREYKPTGLKPTLPTVASKSTTS